MKKIRIIERLICLALIIFISFGALGTKQVFANAYGKYQTINGVTTIRCTYIAWDRAYSRTGISMPNFGNAGDWLKNAKKAGYSTGNTPAADSIAVYSGGTYGHVQYVKSFSGNTIYVDEGGRRDLANKTEGVANNAKYTVSVGGKIWGTHTLIGFIYLKPAHTHSYPVTAAKVEKAPTYTSNGTWKIPCSCGKSSITKDIPALGDANLKPGTYIIQSKLDSNKYVSVTPYESKSGGNISLYSKGVADQEFKISKNSDGTYSFGYYKLVLDVAGAAANGNTQLYTPNGTNAQKWYVVSTGDGYCRVVSKAVYYNLDVVGAGTSNGTNIWTYWDNGTASQRFKFILVECDEHNWDDGVVTKNATETEDGERTYTCKDCQKTRVERFDKLHVHDYRMVSRKEATCTKDAEISLKCSCGKTMTKTGDYEAHSEWTETKPATDKYTTIETKTQYSSATRALDWKKVDSGTIDYGTNWGGFDKSNSLYKKYNQTPVTASEDGNTKIEVATSHLGYIYWHWCTGNKYDKPYNRYISSDKKNEFDTFHAFYSTENYTFVEKANAYEKSNSGVCLDTYWWLKERIDVKRCSYTKYEKAPVGDYGEWSDWSDKPIKSSDSVKVRTRTLYRAYTFIPGKKGHKFGNSLTPATLTADGKICKKCSVCGKAENEKVIYKISSIDLSANNFIYDGKVHVPTVTVKDRAGNVISEGNYSIEYSNSKSSTVGNYSIKVIFKDYYKGDRTLTYSINNNKQSEKTSEKTTEKTTEATTEKKAVANNTKNIAKTAAKEEQRVLNDKTDEAPKGTKFGLLQLRYTKAVGNKLTLKWTKVKGAASYVLYGSKCGTKYKKIGIFTRTTAKAKVKKGKYHKFYVVATSKKKGKGKVVAGSKTIHVISGNKKTGNYKTVKVKNVKNNKLTLKKGKTFKLKTKSIAEKGKIVNNHRKIAYESSNPKVATVTKKGKIKAKKKGTCYIYVYSQSGTFAKVKVTVK